MERYKKPFKRLMFICAIASGFAAISASSLYAAKTCDPQKFGAKGDGKTKDTVALQGAIDACAVQGGGTVLVTAGTYVSAPLVLKSSVTLRLEKGATILGSPDHGDYPAMTMFRLPDLQPLISATNASNIAIDSRKRTNTVNRYPNKAHCGWEPAGGYHTITYKAVSGSMDAYMKGWRRPSRDRQ